MSSRQCTSPPTARGAGNGHDASLAECTREQAVCVVKIVGYSDRLSVRPGETVRFMVSCKQPAYRADIVRLIHGDPNPEGPGFKEAAVPTPVNGEYAGHEKTISTGSYAIVPHAPALQPVGSFTLQAWIYPTTPGKGVQGIITKWSESQRSGYGLLVDENGGLALWLGDGEGSVERIGTGTTLHASRWYFVAGAFDADERRVTLHQLPVDGWPRDESRAETQQVAALSRVGESELPLLMAGIWGLDASGTATVQGHFNGKLDSPRLFSRALGREALESLARDTSPALVEAPVVAWDFARDFAGDSVSDASPRRLHGRLVNMPARAMTGHNWSGNDTDFRRRPGEYGAIHFHDDDLEDAGWEADFELTVPESMGSGFYAARLRAGEDEDYLPFFVRPPRGRTTASIVLLVPTASYLAYANKNETVGKAYPSNQWQDQYVLDNDLLSLYDAHRDGSGVCYSSRLRPIVNMRPKYNQHWLHEGKGAPHLLNADLHLVDWLEARGFRFDVVTDEDLHLEGVEILSPYRVMLTGSHPEYWSAEMLDALQVYLAGGGRVMYLGGNGFYWVTSFDPQRPHVIEVRRWRGTGTWEAEPGELHHSTTGEPGSLWRFRGRAPQRLLGVGFSAYGDDASRPYVRQPDSADPRAAFIFEGVRDNELIGDFGLVMGGAGGYETDRADVGLGTPPHALVVAMTAGFSDNYEPVIEEVLVNDSRHGGAGGSPVRGDMVFFEGPKGGAVFSTGSIAWCGSLSYNDYDNNVSRITENVLRRFDSSEPF